MTNFATLSQQTLLTHDAHFAVCRMEKDKQQLMIEIDSISTGLDSANKAKVRLLLVCIARFHFHVFQSMQQLLQHNFRKEAQVCYSSSLLLRSVREFTTYRVYFGQRTKHSILNLWRNTINLLPQNKCLVYIVFD